MTACCLHTRCNLCCRHTNMLLSDKDIHNITTLGYHRSFFTIQRNGWLRLKNYKGRCIFHNGEHCTIYDHRPEGCVLYPVVYDADRRIAIIDAECPQRRQFFINEQKTRQLKHLIALLQKERVQRENLRKMNRVRCKE